MNATATATQMIPVDQITVDSKNPKSRVEGPEFDRFTEGVRQHGVLQAVLVRPLPGKGRSDGGFHLIAGHRRLAAAKLAGMTTIPAVVRESDEAEDGELRVLENLDRAELHPLDEAEIYRTLSRPPFRLSWQAIADKVGRPLQYVYARSKLANLIKPLADLFRAGTIAAGHAVILARLDPKAQAAAADENRGGLFEREDTLFSEEESKALPNRARGVLGPLKVRTPRELQGWIDDNVRLEQKDVDPVLFPESSATLGRAPKVIPITREYHVRESARSKERTWGPQSWKRADGMAGSKVCEFSTIGFVVVGAGRGESFAVCTNRDKCKVHWATEQEKRATKARKKAAAASDPKAAEKQAAREKSEQLKAKLGREIADETERRVQLNVVEAANRLSPAQIIGCLVRSMDTRDLAGYFELVGYKVLAKDIPGWLKSNDDDAVKLGSLLAYKMLEDDWQDRVPAQFGIDIKAIRKAVETELVAKSAPAAPAKAATKKAAKKSAKKKK